MKHTARRLLTAALLALALAGSGGINPTLAAGPPLAAFAAAPLAQTAPSTPAPVSTISYFGCSGGRAFVCNEDAPNIPAECRLDPGVSRDLPVHG